MRCASGDGGGRHEGWSRAKPGCAPSLGVCRWAAAGMTYRAGAGLRPAAQMRTRLGHAFALLPGAGAAASSVVPSQLTRLSFGGQQAALPAVPAATACPFLALPRRLAQRAVPPALSPAPLRRCTPWMCRHRARAPAGRFTNGRCTGMRGARALATPPPPRQAPQQQRPPLEPRRRRQRPPRVARHQPRTRRTRRRCGASAALRRRRRRSS